MNDSLSPRGITLRHLRFALPARELPTLPQSRLWQSRRQPRGPLLSVSRSRFFYATVYGASEGLKVLLLEKNAPGGQAGSSSRIENYLGFPAGISGLDLTGRAYAQAQKFGAQI